MFWIDTGDFKYTVIDTDDAERTKRNSGCDLNIVHVVNLEMAGLFDPIFDKRIAQGVLRFAFRKIGAFDDKAVLAAFIFTHCRKSWLAERAWRPQFHGKR